MDQEQQALRDLDRAARAKRLLEDELFRETIEGLRETLRAEWERTHADDADRREAAYQALRTLNNVVRLIEEHMTTGFMAEVTLEKIRAAQQPRHRGPGE